MAKLSSLAGTLEAITAQVQKAKDEIVAEVETLKQELADTDIPQDAQDSLDKLGKLAQALDDLNPDPAPPVPPA